MLSTSAKSTNDLAGDTRDRIRPIREISMRNEQARSNTHRESLEGFIAAPFHQQSR